MMKCDFCGLSNPTAIFFHPVNDAMSWAACLECHLLITGGHFLPLVQRAVASVRVLAPRAVAGHTAIAEELRRQTANWLAQEFWSRRNGAPYPMRAPSTFHEPGYCVTCGRMLNDDGRCPVHG